MANIDAARKDIQKVVAFLVNRFGSEEEVFANLTSALTNLQEEEAPASSSGTVAAVVEAEADSSPASAPQKKQAVKAQPAPKTRKGTGKGKK